MLASLTLAALLGASPPLLFADMEPGSGTAHLALARDGATAPLAQVSVADDSVPRGMVSPQGRDAVLALVPPGLDRVHHGELWRLELKNRKLTRLADGVLALERPRFTSDGKRALFLRLVATREPASEEMRQGVLSTATTEVWTAALTGGLQRIASIDALGINLAGVWRDQVLVYRVDAQGASIWRVADTGGEPAQVATIGLPFARDFQVVGDTLVYATLLPTPGDGWGVIELDLRTGTQRVLAREQIDHLAPFAAAGKVLLTRPGTNGEGIADVGGAARLSGFGGRSFGLAASRDGRTLAVRHEMSTTQRLLIAGPSGTIEVPTRGFFEVFGFAESP